MLITLLKLWTLLPIKLATYNRAVFSWVLKVISQLLWFCNATLYYSATLLTNQKQDQNQLWLARMRFPALGSGYMHLLRVLIGSSELLIVRRSVFELVRVITLVLVLRHSIENRSIGFKSKSLQAREKKEKKKGKKIKRLQTLDSRMKRACDIISSLGETPLKTALNRKLY